MQNKVILITGSNGEIGQALIKKFIKDTSNIIITIDLKESVDDFSVHESFCGSILDLDLIETIHSKYEISEIYHLAAVLSTKAEQDPVRSNQVNVEGTSNMFDLCMKQFKKYNHPILFFFPSSIAVYNTTNSKNKRVDENSYCNNPLTVYGKSKLECELNGVIAEKNDSIDFRCIRFPGIISATSKPTGGTSDYAPEMIHAAANGKNYDCFVTPESILPFIVMPDAIDAIEMLMTTAKKNLSSNIYNITSFSPTAYDLFEKTLSFYPEFKVNYVLNQSRQKIINSWPNIINDNLAKQDWGWIAKYNFHKSYTNYLIPSILTYYKQQGAK